jgi:SAM-dependent methyltransferase
MTSGTEPCIACGKTQYIIRSLRVEGREVKLLVSPCGLARLVELPVGQNLSGYYQEGFYSGEEGRRFSGFFDGLYGYFRRARAGKIASRYPRGSILDVGCEKGLMLSELRKMGWEACGTQISENAIAYARNVLGLNVYKGELNELDIKPSSFDLVTFYHVLEHLENPGIYLSEAWRLLRNGGALIVEVPNFGSLCSRLSGGRWFGLDYPRHIYHFTPESMALLLGREGFEIEKISHFSLEYSFFVALQTMLNCLPAKRNSLFNYMRQTRGKRTGSLPERLFMYFSAALFFPFAVFVSAFSSAIKMGDIMTFYCRKKG